MPMNYQEVKYFFGELLAKWQEHFFKGPQSVHLQGRLVSEETEDKHEVEFFSFDGDAEDVRVLFDKGDHKNLILVADVFVLKVDCNKKLERLELQTEYGRLFTSGRNQFCFVCRRQR